jgi:hypothetical protein
MGFRLMTEFIELFDTTHDYTLQFMSSLDAAWQRLREQSPASHSNSSQRLICSSPLTHLLTNQPTPLTDSSLICPAYNISAWTAEKTQLPFTVVSSCSYGIVRFMSVAEPLPSNDCYIVAWFMVVV